MLYMKTIKLTPIKKGVAGEIKIPGSKSYTNRALLLAALTPHPVTILNPLQSDDTHAMIDCLKTLGIDVDVGENLIKVNGSIQDVKNKKYRLNARLSGTTIRFILALLCIVPGTKILEGEDGLNKRPIGPLVEALRQLGAKIEYLGKKGNPPLLIKSSKLKSGNIAISGETSSQYISALLMISPCIPKAGIQVDGEQVSKPYIDMTIDTMKTFGVKVKNDGYKNYELLSKGGYKARKYSVEGDFSSAGYFFALAALTKSEITVRNLNPKSMQPDKKILSVLKDMGNVVRYGKNAITLEGRGVRPISADMTDFPDQAQTLAVLAAFAKGRSILSGLQTLPMKETDRLQAVINELKKMQIKTEKTESKNYALTIYGGAPKPARVKTYGDHRMAMAFAVAGAKLKGMEIKDPQVVAKTFSLFWKFLASLGVGVIGAEQKNIILIGMRGSGKSTISKLLADRLKISHLDVDKLITSEAGLDILDIVRQKGWTYFRDIESKIIKKIFLLSDTVIATGGGAIVREKNASYLKKNGIFVFLNASANILVERNKKLSHNPRLTNKKTIDEEIRVLLKKRNILYKKLADITVSVDGKKPKDIVDEIIIKLKEKNI